MAVGIAPGGQQGSLSKSDALGATGMPGPWAGTSMTTGPATEQISTCFVAAAAGPVARASAGSRLEASSAKATASAAKGRGRTMGRV